MNKTNLELKHHRTDFVGVRKVLSKIGVKKECVLSEGVIAILR